MQQRITAAETKMMVLIMDERPERRAPAALPGGSKSWPPMLLLFSLATYLLLLMPPYLHAWPPTRRSLPVLIIA